MQNKILYTGGTFDLFHYGHVNFLKQCKKLCDTVVVALNTDEFVSQYKQPTIMNYHEREKALLSCPYVSKVIPNLSGQDSKPTILSVRPDIIAIGDDWAHKDYYKQMNFTQEWIEEQGMVLVYIPYTKGISSSEIRKRILNSKVKKNETAFVICCKESTFIYECVDSIKNNYSDDVDIIIVDSCSNDKKYMELKNKHSNLFIEDVCNQNYEYGAILHGFKKYNGYQKYIFIQDALRIKSKIPEIENLKDDEVYFFGDNAKTSGWTADPEAKDFLYKNHPNFPKNSENLFLIAEWNCFSINKKTFEKVINSEIFLSVHPPSEKIGSRMWERVWPTIFSSNNIELKTINEYLYFKLFGSRQ